MLFCINEMKANAAYPRPDALRPLSDNISKASMSRKYATVNLHRVLVEIIQQRNTFWVEGLVEKSVDLITLRMSRVDRSVRQCGDVQEIFRNCQADDEEGIIIAIVWSIWRSLVQGVVEDGNIVRNLAKFPLDKSNIIRLRFASLESEWPCNSRDRQGQKRECKLHACDS